MKLSKQALWGMIAGIGAAILVLMVFSLDRTAWALSLFETGRQLQHERALAGSIVIELAVIAFIIARSVNVAEIRHLAIIGLCATLFVQTLANLWGGWVYGWEATRATLPASEAAFAVSAAAWLSINALIPGGIFLLSEIEALLVRYLIATYAEERTSAPVADPHPATAPAPTYQVAPVESHPIAPAPEIAPVAPQAVRVVAAIEPQAAPVEVAHPEPAHRTGVLKIPAAKKRTWDQIIDRVTVSAPAPQAAIGEELGVSESMVRKHLREMTEEGVLVKDGKSYRKNGVLLEVI